MTMDTVDSSESIDDPQVEATSSLVAKFSNISENKTKTVFLNLLILSLSFYLLEL